MTSFVLRGVTDHFQVYFRDDLGSPGQDVADHILAACETDYSFLQSVFGGLTPPGIPFQIRVFPAGSIGGASHSGCSSTSIIVDAVLGDTYRSVLLAVASEVAEVLMAAAGTGWDCSASHGEALSRVLGAILYPHDIDGDATAKLWLASNRDDWVTRNFPSDGDKTSIGCGSLFLSYLRYQCQYGWDQITQARATTLSSVYFDVGTNIKPIPRSGDAFEPFAGLIRRAYTASASFDKDAGMDNPFPLTPDILFYDPENDEIELTSVAATGDDIERIALFPAGGHTPHWWTDIVAGSFTDTVLSDLVLYDRHTGTTEIRSADGTGAFTLLYTTTLGVDIASYNDNRSRIVPGRFSRDGAYSGLVVYEPAHQRGYLLQPRGNGDFRGFGPDHLGWRSTWQRIAAGNFTRGSSLSDLLFYDLNSEVIEMYSSNGDGTFRWLCGQSEQPGASWQVIVPCNFTGGQLSDLLLYSAFTNKLEFRTTDGYGNWRTLTTYSDFPPCTDIVTLGFGLLLCYNRDAGEGRFYSVNSDGAARFITSHLGWRKTWTKIIAGHFVEWR